MTYEPLLSFILGLVSFSGLSFITHNLHLKVQHKLGRRAEIILRKASFLFSFVLSFLLLKLFGIEIPYWPVILVWGTFHFIISYIRMSKWLRFSLYALSLAILWRFSGLKIGYILNDELFPLSPFISIIYFMVIMYFFSYLSELSGFANGIFFVITLSFFIGVKFFLGVGIEELNLLSFLLSISFGVFFFELVIPHFRLDRSEGRFLGFLIALFSIYSNTEMILFEALLLPIAILLVLIAVYFYLFYRSFRKKTQNKHEDYIVQYSRYDVFLFVYLVLFNISLIAILLREWGVGHSIVILLSLIFLVGEFFLFQNFLKGKKIPLKKNEARVKILGLEVDNLDFYGVLDRINDAIVQNDKLFAVTLNPVMIMNGLENSKLMKIYSKAGLVIPDGIGVVWASFFLGTPLEERVAGVEIVEHILNHPPKDDFRVLLFGAKRGIAKRIKREFKKKFPKLEIDVLDGYSNYNEKETLRMKIREVGYDLILVALGSPAQESWIDKEFDNTEKGVFIGVGGSFDIISGIKKRVNKKWQKHGLEWFFRIFAEPHKRLNQFFQLGSFVLKIFIERLEEF